MDREKFDPRGERAMVEKLKLQKEIERRNEERRKEFAKMKVEQEEKYMLLVDLYICGEMSEEDFHRHIRKLRAGEKQ